MPRTLAPLLGLLLISLLPLLGQDTLKNGDFSDGTTHWHGAGKPIGGDSTDLTTSASSNAKGMVIELKPATWATVKQDMRGLKPHLSGADLKLEIDYQTSADFSLSDRATDYTSDDPKAGIGTALGFESTRIVGKPGQLLVFLNVAPSNRTSLSGNTVTIYLDRVSKLDFTPAVNIAQTCTATMQMPRFSGDNDATFCIAVPPGKGTITITKIALEEAPRTAPANP